MIDRLRRLSPIAIGALTVVTVSLPLVVAVAALAQRRWYPVLDLAMTELRARDFGSRRTPLIGLPGRIGDLPEQGSHPGPLSFWLLAPGYRLFGSSAWSLEVATVSIALIWTSLATWIGYRRLGFTGVAMVAAVVAVLTRGFGLTALVQPWNPYLPLFAWLVVLLATWSVLCGDHLMLLPLVAAASFSAQTHIPYLLMSGALGVLAVGVVLVRWFRASRANEGTRTSPRPFTAVVLTAGAFVVLWLAPMVDQVRNGDDGNVARLIDHFGSPPEEAIGLVAGFRLMLRHLDITPFLQLLTGSNRFIEAGLDSDGPIVPGAILLVVWIGSVVVARRLRHSVLVNLHTVLGVTLALTVISMARIFGIRWYYLTLWAWITTTLILVAVCWTAVAWLRSHQGSVADTLTTARLTAAAFCVAGITTISMLVVAPSTEHAEEYLGDTIGDLLPNTVDALNPDESYVVEFRDAVSFGSQAFGLVSELERAGFDAGMEEYWVVPITEYRAKPALGDDRRIVFVSGGFIDEWRADPDFTEVALVDPRTDEERARYEELRTTLVTDLTDDGLTDLLDLVDTNLFALTIDPRISPTAQETTVQMLRIGQQAAVFLGPAAGDG